MNSVVNWRLLIIATSTMRESSRNTKSVPESGLWNCQAGTDGWMLPLISGA